MAKASAKSSSKSKATAKGSKPAAASKASPKGGAKKEVKKVTKPSAKPAKVDKKAQAKAAAKAKPAAKPAKAAKVDKKAVAKETAKKAKEIKKSAATIAAEKAKEAKKAKEEELKKAKEEAEKKKAKEAKPVKDAKAKKGKKAEEEEEDDFLTSDDDFDGSEIDEYSDELQDIEEAEDTSIEDFDELYEASLKDRPDEEVVLTDAEGRRYCRVRECDQIASVDIYCRYHYLLLWKKIQVRKKILTDGKLERYVEELTSRYPDKFLEMIRRDLRTEKDFLGAIQEMEIDDSSVDNDYEDDAQTYIEEVRGITETGSVEDEEF